MTISIKVAETAGEMNEVFRLRHQVYVEEEGRFRPQPGGFFFDRFDCYASTRSVLARDLSAPGRPMVGTLRFALQNEVGLPSDAFHDFSGVVACLEGGTSTIGMLATARQFRRSLGVVAGICVIGMCKFAAREIRKAGGRHIVAPVSPDIEPALRALGGLQVGEVIYHGDPPVKMTPMHIDLDGLTPFFRETIVDPRNVLFDDLNERRLFRHGEVVLREGDPGEEAFLIMHGAVRVISGDPEDGRLVCLLGPGEIIGEMALLDGGLRSASVVAHSRSLDLAVIPKRDFQARVATDADFCRQMLAILGERARKVLLRLPPDSLLQFDQATLTANVLIEVSAGGTNAVDRTWLAAECGLTAHKLGATLDAWEAAGIVSHGGGLIEVRDLVGLRAIASQGASRGKRDSVELRSVA